MVADVFDDEWGDLLRVGPVRENRRAPEHRTQLRSATDASRHIDIDAAKSANTALPHTLTGYSEFLATFGSAGRGWD